MTSPLWTSADIAAATKGQHAHTCDATGDTTGHIIGDVTGVSIDTRTLRPGDLFIALQGPNFDGHDYADAAMAAGAAGVLSARALSVPHIQVRDTQRALHDLGRAARDRFQGDVIAITGSVGKTTTRALAAAAFGTFATVHATRGNLNNHLGVPLTLANMPLDTEVAIIEMGMNHFGEIAALSALARPTAAIITAIDWVHSENLDGTLAGVARAKLEITHGLTGPLYAPVSLKPLLFAQLPEHVGGAGEAEKITEIEQAGHADHTGQTQQEVRWVEAPYAGPLRLAGAAHAWNAALALAPIPAVHQDQAQRALATVEPAPGRGCTQTLTLGGASVVVIDEAYNASPASMMAAISNLRSAPGARKIAVVGHMAELANPLKHHENLGNFLAENPVDMVIAVGKFHQSILKPLPSTILSMGFDTPAGVVPYLTAQIQTGDVVLVKASNSTGLGRVVTELLSLD